MNDFKIREATIDDARGIATVQYYGWQETYRGIIHDSYLDEMSIQEGEVRWKKIISHPNTNKFASVLENDKNEIIGMISGGRSRSNEFKMHGEIYALYLLKEFHGKNLGQKLFLHGVEQLKTFDYKSFCLSVLTQNPTVNFYRKFNPDLEDTDSEEIGGVDYDEVVLGWSDVNKFPS